MCSVTSIATDIIALLAFEVRSIQAAKSKSSSCPRKNPAMSCGPFTKHCYHQSLESENWFLTYKICLVLTAMLPHAHGSKTRAGMHCNHVLHDLTFIGMESSTDNSQQEAIDCNIDLWSRLHCFSMRDTCEFCIQQIDVSFHASVLLLIRNFVITLSK